MEPYVRLAFCVPSLSFTVLTKERTKPKNNIPNFLKQTTVHKTTREMQCQKHFLLQYVDADIQNAKSYK